MSQWFYLLGLLGAITGMALLDRRFQLAYWYDRRRTVLTVLIGLAVFLIWDLLGIQLGIFAHGGGDYMLPFTLLPEFPFEEIVFLLLLCYCTLVVYRGGVKLWQRT